MEKSKEEIKIKALEDRVQVLENAFINLYETFLDTEEQNLYFLKLLAGSMTGEKVIDKNKLN